MRGIDRQGVESQRFLLERGKAMLKSTKATLISAIGLSLLLAAILTVSSLWATPVHAAWSCRLGYHLQNLFDKCGTVDNDLLAIIQTLSPTVVRFPAGAGANYYRYEPTRNRLYRPDTRQLIYLPEVVRTLTALNADVIFVANIYSSLNTAEVTDLMGYLLHNGVKIVGVELGNELYSNSYTQMNGDVEIYIAAAKSYATAIKALWPTMKIAVPAAPIGVLRKTAQNSLSPPYEKYIQWMKRLALEDWYDAYAPHLYMGFVACGTTEIGFDCLITQINDYSDNVLMNLFHEYEYLYGASREIWITEWNLYNAGDAGNTIAQAIYVPRFVLSMNALNEAEFGGRIKYLIFHQLANCSKEGGTREVNSIAHRLPGEEAVDVGTDYIKLTPYYSFLFLGQLSGAETAWDDSLTDMQLTEGTGLKYHTFKDGYHVYLYIINDSPIDYTVKSLAISGTTIGRTHLARYQRLYGEGLGDSRGYVVSLKSFANSLATYTETAFSPIENYIIPHYSVGLVTIDLP